MTPFFTPDADTEQRLARRLLDVLIRAALLLAMAILCYRVLAPFLPLAIWAVIFAVTLYPLQLRIRGASWGKAGSLPRPCWCCSGSRCSSCLS